MSRKQIAVIFLMLLPLPVWAQQSHLQSITLASGYVPGAVEIAVLQPAEVKASEGSTAPNPIFSWRRWF